jgi:DHA1 family tetracycline resistance protein-like MFS transporter
MANERGLGSLYMAVLLDSMGAFMVMPLLPYIAKEFGATVLDISLLASAFAASQTIGTVILGSLSDYVGRRRILLTTLGGCCFALLFCGLSRSVWQLITARALNGLFASTVGVCQTMIAERSPKEVRAEALARVMGFFSIGVFAGPVFGGFLKQLIGLSGVCFVAFGLTAMNVIWAFFQLDDEVQPGTVETDRADTAVGGDPVLQALRQFCQRPVLILILLSTFLQTSVLGFFMGSGAWYNLQEYGFVAWQNGLLVAVGGAAMLCCQFYVTGPAVRWLTELGCIWLGSILRCCSMLVYALAPPSTNPFDIVPYVCIIPLMATMALVDPSLQTLTVDIAPPKSLGTVMGVAQALRSGGEAVAPVMSAYAYEQDHRLPWLLAAGFAALGGMLYIQKRPAYVKANPTLLERGLQPRSGKSEEALKEPLLAP